MGFTCPGIKNWEWFHLLSGAPRYWELHEIWTWLHLCLACLPPPGHVTKLCWTCQLKVSKYWSSWNWCLFFFFVFDFLSCVVVHKNSNTRSDLVSVLLNILTTVKPPHITFPNSSSLCFRDFLCQRWFLFAYQPPKDFPSLSLFSCPLNPCKVLAAVTSPGEEFPSFLSQLHGELLPRVCFEPAICLLHPMPLALC